MKPFAVALVAAVLSTTAVAQDKVILGISGWTGFAPLSLADKAGGGLPLTLAGTALAALFLARGVVGYTPRWRKVFTEEPFATLDRKNYSPLCLAIGIGFVILVVLRLL